VDRERIKPKVSYARIYKLRGSPSGIDEIFLEGNDAISFGTL